MEETWEENEVRGEEQMQSLEHREFELLVKHHDRKALWVWNSLGTDLGITANLNLCKYKHGQVNREERSNLRNTSTDEKDRKK